MSETIPAWESFQGRPRPHKGMKVKLYKNLNRQRRFSLVAMEGEHKGKVLGYSPAVLVRSVEMKVSEAGRQTVIRQGVRNVHAHCICFVEDLASELPPNVATEKAKRITYQPFLCGHFWDREDPKQPIWKLDSAWAYGPDLISPT
ncbi:hypothetical protein [Marinobacter sp.]|uniref:hypothetical protein n=1 Tax=Marinobacter sp. TaxID=50741 RepID=UPI00356AEC6C